MGAGASAQGYTRAQLTALVAEAYDGEAADAALTISQVTEKLHGKAAAAARAAAPADAEADPENDWRSVVLDDPISRDERATALRQIFDALDEDGDHSITRRDYVVTLAARGVPVEDAQTEFSAMDAMGTNRLTVAKFDHFVLKRTITKIRDTFFAIDEADGTKDRQLTREDVTRYFIQNGLSREQARTLYETLDANHNGKVAFKEWRHWASDRLAKLVVKEEQAKVNRILDL